MESMTNNITKFLNELSELEAKATSGPWETYKDPCGDLSGIREASERAWDIVTCYIPYENQGIDKQEDAKFIVASRNALPRLIEAMRVLIRACEYNSEHKLDAAQTCKKCKSITIFQIADGFKIAKQALAKAEEIINCH